MAKKNSPTYVSDHCAACFTIASLHAVVTRLLPIRPTSLGLFFGSSPSVPWLLTHTRLGISLSDFCISDAGEQYGRVRQFVTDILLLFYCRFPLSSIIIIVSSGSSKPGFLCSRGWNATRTATVPRPSLGLGVAPLSPARLLSCHSNLYTVKPGTGQPCQSVSLRAHWPFPRRAETSQSGDPRLLNIGFVVSRVRSALPHSMVYAEG